ncbi:hypothetical protein [Parachlamydia sp. AcF125]|uniref:hypothetical protein n=1 Tax=Parachlamydia sp. AcF125 TaxID=2795736 RepID=UPI001BCA2263|nr:hypothetical protein [Parachlamydia sp. AcF125]MBS4168206.1 hypothetical protein [Parachlamydia sp. AcF125]
MDFTREPIIETVITPREGCKIVVRSSKSVGQEEYFVDAVEVVSFGSSFFFRSLERPKAFLVPATDYEILEVRETRMVLKSVGLDRSIKIGGGKEQAAKPLKESTIEKITEPMPEESGEAKAEEAAAVKGEARLDKKRERRRHYRRKRGREEGKEEHALDEKEEGSESEIKKEEKKIELVAPVEATDETEELPLQPVGSPTTSLFSSLLAPPPTLISETIALYKENELFKNVFFTPKKDQGEEDQEDEERDADEEKIPLAEPLISQEAAFGEEENEFDKDPFRDLEQLEIAFPPLEEGMDEELGFYEEEVEVEREATEEETEESPLHDSQEGSLEEESPEHVAESKESDSSVEPGEEEEKEDKHSEDKPHYNSSASNDSQ